MNPLIGPKSWMSLSNSEHEELKAKLQAANTNIPAINLGTINAMQTPLCRALNNFITDNPYMKGVKSKADRLSTLSDEVLITGDTGTGKELIAMILHGNRVGPFIAINVAAITDTLIESELFGHLKGSFTGASSDRAGLIETAGTGTLFIDEIGDMSLGNQTKLLRVLQEKRYRPVGSSVDKESKCRFIFATHRDLGDMARNKKFRLDLYYRINIFRLSLLRLAKRTEDIPLIARSLGIPDNQLELFMLKLSTLDEGDKNWEGNIRQLQGYVRRFLVFGGID